MFYYLGIIQFHRFFSGNISYHLSKKLNIDLMRDAAKKLLGTHDFIGFSSLKKSPKSTIRTMKDIKIVKEGNMVAFIFYWGWVFV
jgi:tRNA pseudouridine38-40 synthase